MVPTVSLITATISMSKSCREISFNCTHKSVLDCKGTVQPKLIFHPCTTHHFLDGGSSDNLMSPYGSCGVTQVFRSVAGATFTLALASMASWFTFYYNLPYLWELNEPQLTSRHSDDTMQAVLEQVMFIFFSFVCLTFNTRPLWAFPPWSSVTVIWIRKCHQGLNQHSDEWKTDKISILGKLHLYSSDFR